MQRDAACSPCGAEDRRAAPRPEARAAPRRAASAGALHGFLAIDRRFLAEARRQLAERGIRGELELSGRLSLRVAGQRILGHSVRVLGLSSEDSLKLQIHGLGGKRTMGCGIFRPVRIVVRAREVA
jgi:hypothetical protein